MPFQPDPRQDVEMADLLGDLQDPYSQPSDEEDNVTLRNRGTPTGRSAAYQALNKQPVICCLADLPAWHLPVSNPHILTGYRVNYTFKHCFWSIFELHNDTLNVWSHLVGFLIWLLMAIRVRTMPAYISVEEVTQNLIVVCYVLCSFMPLFSSLYHTFLPSRPCCVLASNGPTMQPCLLRVDLFGICSLWFARALLEGHLVMFCEPDAFNSYMTICALVFGGTVPLVLLTKSYFWFGPLFGVVHYPLMRLIANASYTRETMDSRVITHISLSTLGTLCLALGLFFFFNYWPESKFPLRFDIWGSSHQWWHFFTWLGPTLVLIGFNYLLDFRVASGC